MALNFGDTVEAERQARFVAALPPGVSCYDPISQRVLRRDEISTYDATEPPDDADIIGLLDYAYVLRKARRHPHIRARLLGKLVGRALPMGAERRFMERACGKVSWCAGISAGQ